jgi:hypothetical protein
MGIRWLPVARDALATVIARSLLRAALDAAGVGDQGLALLDLGVLALAGCVVGCLAPVGRFATIAATAVVVWLVTVAIAWISGVALGVGAAVATLVSPTLLAMLLGGAASLAIVRAPGAGAPPGRDGGESTPARS